MTDQLAESELPQTVPLMEPNGMGWRFGRHHLCLLAVFVLSRVAYYAAGVCFDDRPLRTFYQVFDPALLQNRLAETLFYAHSQPPGFNLIIGLLLKMASAHFAAAAHALYIALGLFILFSLYELMRLLKIPETLAALAAGLFMVTPGVVLYENFLLYEYPLLAILCASGLCIWHLFHRPRTATAFTLFTLTSALVFTRSLFPLPYLILVVAIAVWLFPGRRRQFLTAAVLPVALATGLYLKNWILYGQFASSTWMGFALYTVSIHQLHPAERDRLINQGHLSELERLPPMEALPVYSAFVHPAAPIGIPVLDQKRDSTGRTNFNNVEYFQLHRIYMQDAKHLLLRHPAAFGKSLLTALFTYFLPTGDFPFFGENRGRIHTLDRWVNILAFGQLREAPARVDLRALWAGGASIWSFLLYTGSFLIFGLPALFAYGCKTLWTALRQPRWRTPQNALLAFMLLNIAMLTTVVTLFSSFENNRYRLTIDGFFVILAAMVVKSWIPNRRGSSMMRGLNSRARTGNGRSSLRPSHSANPHFATAIVAPRGSIRTKRFIGKRIVCSLLKPPSRAAIMVSECRNSKH